MRLFDLLSASNPWWADPLLRSGVSARRRSIFPRLREMLGPAAPGDRAVVLVGPRQVGKTTLLHQLADDLLDAGLPPGNLALFDFSDERAPESGSLREVADHRPPGLMEGRPRILLLDEITRAKDWDLALKSLVDRGRHSPGSGWKILVTDSAASILRSGARESLQGRVDEIRISGLSLSEFLTFHALGEERPEDVLYRHPNLAERYLSLGGFPEHALSDPSPCVRRLVREDIADRAIARDLARYGVDVERIRDLFVALVLDAGGVFEASTYAKALDGALRDRGTDARTIHSWVRILEGAGLLRPLRPRHATAKGGRLAGARRLRARPKLYPEDHALVSAFAPLTDPMSHPDVRAKVLETAVLRHLREAYDGSGVELTYFRRSEKLEIDFVLDFPDGRSIGIEVTSSPRAGKKLAKLPAAARAARLDDVVLVHGDVEESEKEGLRPVPFSSFLLETRRNCEGGSG